MQPQTFFAPGWATETGDQSRESVTHLYTRPPTAVVPPLPPPPPMYRRDPSQRLVWTVDVAPDTQPVRKARRLPRVPLIGVGFAVLCALVGVALGCLVGSGDASATPVAAIAVPVSAPGVAAVAPVGPPVGHVGPAVVVTPIEVPPPPAPLFVPDAIQPIAPVFVATAAVVPVAPAPVHHAAPAAAAAPAPAMGILKVSAKPPCRIIIDGKATGLTTPQAALKLSVGAHKVRLVNQAQGLDLTSSVHVTAGQPTRLIHDFTND